ncbi:hypothetical protein UlMin_012739 [Ulmus minor]
MGGSDYHSYYSDENRYLKSPNQFHVGESSSLIKPMPLESQWRNLQAEKPESSNPYSNSGLWPLGRYESNLYATSVEKGYGNSEFSGSVPAINYGHLDGYFASPLEKLMVCKKNEEFLHGNHPHWDVASIKPSYDHGYRPMLFGESSLELYNNGYPLRSKEMVIGNSNVGTFPTDFRENYEHKDCLRPSIVDLAANKFNVMEGSLEEKQHSRVWINLQSLGQGSSSLDGDFNGALYLNAQNGEVLGSKSRLTEFENVVYKDYEILPHYDGDVALNKLAMSEGDRGLHETIGVGQQGLDHSYERILGGEHFKKCNLNDSHQCYGDENWTNVDVDQGLIFIEDQWNVHDENRPYFDDLSASSSSLLASARGHSSGRLKSAANDIKRRLGPVNKILSSKSSRGTFKKQSKFLRSRANDFNRSLNSDSGGGYTHYPNAGVKPSKNELSEDSNEFNWLVHRAFFKFIKNLNENPAQRRKYLEQEGQFSLRCAACGRNSKEFVDKMALLQHAFMSRNASSRTEHLGFHKALCVLLGWNSATAPNSPWVRQILPDAEALALREDLIIWPPLVIIHNISIVSGNQEDRVIVSIQRLEAILRSKGFDRDTIKLFRGKPANQSILVATFNASLFGLLEAERLHKLYVENKHGRNELLQIKSICHSNMSNEIRRLSKADKAEIILYGYLGLAEDLDKLDFHTKSSCVVRSKKEIQVFSKATL